MTALLYIAIYCGLAIFVGGCLRLVVRYSALPIHLRWELYPVPHEPSPRSSYGGSYYEQTEWWTAPRHLNRIGELRAMASEIFTLESVRKNNRGLWLRSLLFHTGIFAVCGSIALAFTAVATGRLFPSWFLYLHLFSSALFYIGLAAILIGSVSLLLRRMLDPAMREYTYGADYLHLVAIAFAAALLLAASLDRSSPGPTLLIAAVLRFDTSLHIPALLTVALLLCAALVAYIPFSRMAHFVGKYFGYHTIRWDDAPNRNAPFSGSLKHSLTFKPTWSAAHLGADGTRTWADIASTNPAAAEVKK